MFRWLIYIGIFIIPPRHNLFYTPEWHEQYLPHLDTNEEMNGFLYLESKDISINPKTQTITFQQPNTPKGTQNFAKRNEYEKDFLEQIKHSAVPYSETTVIGSFESDNQIFSKTSGSLEEYHPMLGGRIAITIINFYETAKKGTLMAMPILPHQQTVYGGSAKLGGSDKHKTNFSVLKQH